MVKYRTMNLTELQDKLENLCQNISKEVFIFNLLEIYDFPKSRLTILKKASSDSLDKKLPAVIKNKLYFKETTLEEDEHYVIDELKNDKAVLKFNPRFIIVTDFDTFLAIDTKTNETLDINIKDLSRHYAFFLPWVGMEKTQIVNENPADIRAASKMAKLFDQIVKDDPEYAKNNLHDLNILLSRLLFCFFAEDTKIFEETLFTNSIGSHTVKDGSNLKIHLKDIFTIFNTAYKDRKSAPDHLSHFPYVNGGLFEKDIELPDFREPSRVIILECGKLDWSEINPDIFGSMIQAVVHPGLRENLGMHYTSVPNIMKVIKPLFLDDLWEEFHKCNNSKKKLEELRKRISQIRIFDPACGSGNFLIISYKELCKLEAEILKEITDSQADRLDLNLNFSSITLNNFYGIEIDDFAHEIAKLSLYLAQHQMNMMFEKEFGKLKPILPLKESGNIVCGNSTRFNWEEVCPREDSIGNQIEIHVAGNPPYLGSRNQDDEQKSDLEYIFKKDYKSLDYISAWFYKGADYISGYKKINLAFVSTNSIAQGEQVALLWPRIFSKKLEILFAYQSFKWNNSAKNNAGVTVVIIGISNIDNESKKTLFLEKNKVETDYINPYLTTGKVSEITRRSNPIALDFPDMVYGNLLNDGGNFILSKEEVDQLFNSYPEVKKVIRKLVGSQEFIKGTTRYCLYITDSNLAYAKSIPEINSRLLNIKRLREKSTEKSTRASAETSHRYYFHAHKETTSIIVPRTSSENRMYIPIGFLDKDTIISDAAQVIYNPEPYIFGVVTSRMHMVWVRAVGGKLEDRIRYSSALCYNTFPFPKITDRQKEIITNQVYNILEEREKYPGKTMADLYDFEKMPSGLRQAHEYLDEVIDKIYRQKPFENDEERLVHLFKLYEEMTEEEKLLKK